ncbi:MAG: cyclase family protein, partial [Anaerolineales bacterium]|nr:cyclase family protein [Anaerolineales bacterium]
MKRYSDISQPVAGNMVTWPGRSPPAHTWENRLQDGDHANASTWRMSAHTGTHMDAPLHFIEGGRAIDQIPPAVYIGKCRVIDRSSAGDPAISEEIARKFRGEQRLLVKTRHSDEILAGRYPAHGALLTPAAASILIEADLLLL